MTGTDMILIKEAEEQIAAILRKLEEETNSVILEVQLEEQKTQSLSESHPSFVATIKLVLRSPVQRWRE